MPAPVLSPPRVPYHVPLTKTCARTLTKDVRGVGGSSVLVEFANTTPPPTPGAGDSPDKIFVSAADAPLEGWIQRVDSGKHPTCKPQDPQEGGGGA